MKIWMQSVERALESSTTEEETLELRALISPDRQSCTISSILLSTPTGQALH